MKLPPIEDHGFNPAGVYTFTNAGVCRYCTSSVLWFLTPERAEKGPGGRLQARRGKMPVEREPFLANFRKTGIPLDLAKNYTIDREAAQSLILPFVHFGKCPGSDRARRKARGR